MLADNVGAATPGVAQLRSAHHRFEGGEELVGGAVGSRSGASLSFPAEQALQLDLHLDSTLRPLKMAGSSAAQRRILKNSDPAPSLCPPRRLRTPRAPVHELHHSHTIWHTRSLRMHELGARHNHSPGTRATARSSRQAIRTALPAKGRSADRHSWGERSAREAFNAGNPKSVRRAHRGDV